MNNPDYEDGRYMTTVDLTGNTREVVIKNDHLRLVLPDGSLGTSYSAGFFFKVNKLLGKIGEAE